MEAKKAVYFPGLNALRYIAAAIVVSCHVEEFKKLFYLPSYFDIPFVAVLAGSAVTFFFVLSGFLISYLLFKEKETKGDINVGSFYIRRALRIWPVYYLISILALFVLPYIGFLQMPEYSAKVQAEYPNNALFYLAFLPNVSRLYYVLPYAGHLWSVGVEEQFYLFWPWVFKLVKNQLPIMLLIVIMFFIMRVTSDVLGYHWLSSDNRHIAQSISFLLNQTRIDCMAIGGIGAYFIYNEIELFRRIFINTAAEIIALFGAALMMFNVVKIPYIQHDVMSVFFLVLLVNIACGRKSVLRLEGKVWAFLGNISYSVYMYQYLAIGVVLYCFRSMHHTSFSLWYNLAFHVFCQALTIVIAYLSYRFFETPFLKLKQKFTFVRSTTNPVVA